MSPWEEGDDTELEYAGRDGGLNQAVSEKEVAHLSLNSMAELNSPQTLKVKGSIWGREVVVLIDGGATQFH